MTTPQKRSTTTLKVTVVLAALSLSLAMRATAASKEKPLYMFRGGSDGDLPYGGLAFDAAGNLYGTTSSGGINNTNVCPQQDGCGTVFRLSRTQQGHWQKTVIHSFDPQQGDGAVPFGGLVIDKAGNLYGTTVTGGIVNSSICPGGCGTVFRVTPSRDGHWRETIIHRFDYDKGDGIEPRGNLVFDKAGNLYGATEFGGGSSNCGEGCGAVFQLAPLKGGRWKEQVLHAFAGDDGYDVYDPGLIFDAKGNLYGEVFAGGSEFLGYGTVFELSPSVGGWTETLLYTFTGYPYDGASPEGGLTFDQDGNLLGTTWYGGTHCNPDGCGAAFRLSPLSGGGWKETILHDFTKKGTDGTYPDTGLVAGRTGHLYGATVEGGKQLSGTVFELLPTFRVLYSFNGGKSGSEPRAILYKAGKLYGITWAGGDLQCGVYGCGVVFEITP